MKEKITEYFSKFNPLNFKDETIINISKLANGESNVNYLLETNLNKYVLRFDIVNKSRKLFEQEYNILKLIEELNISPKALYIDTSKKFFKENFMIISFVQGIPLENLSDKSYKKRYSTLAKEVASLHNLNIKFENVEYSMKKWIENTLKSIEELKKNSPVNLEELFDSYLSNFDKMYSKYGYVEAFCHLDLGLLNILYDGEKFSIIDWESAGMNDPALEMSIIFYEQNFTDREKEEFLNVYLKNREDSSVYDRMNFTNFLIAYSGFFANLNTVINIVKGKGHRDYLENVNFNEYWNWGMYYFDLVVNQGFIGKEFKEKLNKLRESI